ncbi:cytochrome P450 [Durotheca rogersii]|uniref:cytochrome P450 n=1 Tax=Durotheca rogersii TaxID=419775 RepID=UPI00221F2949|nr:cytochrome P450 [Durotheca rogersii]KAI5860390.1 cytochrome P450 [Durotheca rogersii]
MKPLVSDNVIMTANRPIWKKLHSAIASAFLASHIRTQAGLTADETMLFRKRLQQLSKGSEVFSIEDEAAKLVFDIVRHIVFNFPPNAQTEGCSYLEGLKETIELFNAQLSKNPLIKLKATTRTEWVGKRVDISIAAKTCERFAALRSEIIVRSRKDPLSILDLLLRETVLQAGTEKGEKAVELPAGGLKLLLTKDFFSFIYMLLEKHLEIGQKLRKEHNAIFGRSLASGLEVLTESPIKLNDMEYTTAVIKESLRLFPVGFGVKEAPAG